ncbi:uncharacterized protein LOC108103130 [Drosophila eugracilis]|uniref:uncharacterized protein LOC108103130 n=1 Tax=Drosophila eugracilis TaxID=29029 RepID=UPI0007E85204|nr:uncharacterized protein LOC108103130 [Drosophila eugracilis]
MRSIILVFALALAAVSAVPLQEGQEVALQDIFKEFGLELDMKFDTDLELNLEKLLAEDDNVEAGEFGFGNRIVSFFIGEAKALAKDIVKLAERELLNIFLYPVRELEKLAEDIERRATEAEGCAIDVTSSVADIVESTTVDFLSCGRNAAVTSIDLCLDTKKAVLQLTVDGYQLLKQRRKCNNMNSTGIRYTTCKSVYYAKLSLFILNGQASLRHLIALRKTVPAVATDATACTNQATQNAVQRFNDINATIDTCIANIF